MVCGVCVEGCVINAYRSCTLFSLQHALIGCRTSEAPDESHEHGGYGLWDRRSRLVARVRLQGPRVSVNVYFLIGWPV